MKQAISILWAVIVSCSSFGSEIAVEVYKGKINFVDNHISRSFVLADRIVVKDELLASVFRGIAELETMGEVKVAESSRPWIGEPLYLVVLENKEQIGRIIQVYSERGDGEFSIFQGVKSDDALSVDIDTCQKYNSKTFEQLILRTITRKDTKQ